MPPYKYPWDKWFSKDEFTITRKDYTCNTHSMTTAIKHRAMHYRYKVRMNTNWDTGVIKVTIVSRPPAKKGK